MAKHISLNDKLLFPLTAHLALFRVLGSMHANNVVNDFSFERFAPNLDFSENSVEGRQNCALVSRAFLLNEPEAVALLDLEQLISAPPWAPALIWSLASYSPYYSVRLSLFQLGMYLLGKQSPAATKEEIHVWAQFTFLKYLDAFLNALPDRDNVPLFLRVTNTLLAQALSVTGVQEFRYWVEQIMPHYSGHWKTSRWILTWFSLARAHIADERDLSYNLSCVRCWNNGFYLKDKMSWLTMNMSRNLRDCAMRIAEVYSNHNKWLTINDTWNMLSEEDIFSLMFYVVSFEQYYQDALRIIGQRSGKGEINSVADVVLLAAQTPTGARTMKRYIMFESGFEQLMTLLHNEFVDAQSRGESTARIEEAAATVCEMYAIDAAVMTMNDWEKVWKVKDYFQGSARFAAFREKLRYLGEEAMQHIAARHIMALEIVRQAQTLATSLSSLEDAEHCAALIAERMFTHDSLIKSPPCSATAFTSLDDLRL